MTSTFGADARRRAVARGEAAELAVCRVLVEAGFVVLARRWQGQGRELDIVASRGPIIRFVEVKARDVGGGVEDEAVDAVDDLKLGRVADAAEAWLEAHPGDWTDLAFVVASVACEGDDEHVTLLDDAFDAPR